MSTPNDRYLTLDRLRSMIESDEVDTVVLAFTDMQGRLQGKRLHGRYFLDVALEHGTEGCNYLLAVDIDMNTVERLLDLLVGAGLRRHGVRPRLGHAAAAAPPARDRDGAVRPRLARPRPGGAVARARSSRQQLERVAAKDMVALAGTELEFIAFNNTYEDAHDRRWRDLTPANQYNVDYSLIGTSRVEPLLRDIRNHMYAAGTRRRGREGRVQLRPARDRLPLRRGARHRRQPRRLQDRRQGDRLPARQGAHLHGEVRRARGQLLPHPPVAARRRRQHRLRRGRRALAALRPVRRRRARDDDGLHPALRAEHQLLQAIRLRLVRADRRRLGHRQPHLRRAPGRARRRRAGWRTGCPAAT